MYHFGHSRKFHILLKCRHLFYSASAILRTGVGLVGFGQPLIDGRVRSGRVGSVEEVGQGRHNHVTNVDKVHGPPRV